MSRYDPFFQSLLTLILSPLLFFLSCVYSASRYLVDTFISPAPSLSHIPASSSNGECIVITGASSGLGKAIAIEYAKNLPSAYLVLTGRSKERLEEVQQICKDMGAKNIQIGIVDVCDRKQMKDFLEKVDSITPITIIYANAGVSNIMVKTANPDATEEEIAHTVIDTNMIGVSNTLFPLLSPFKKRRSGQMVIISSLAGYFPWADAYAYSASKAGVTTLGRALRAKLSSYNVGVTVVAPGFVYTPLTAVNKFTMPMIMSDEKAAKIIVEGVLRNEATISFPLPMFLLTFLLSIIPADLVASVFGKFIRDPSAR